MIRPRASAPLLVAIISAAVTGKIDVRNHNLTATETELDQSMEESA